MNSWSGIGRLVRDPELRHTTSGNAVASFTLAVDRAGDKQDDGTYEAGFFDVTCWGKTAENVAQYLSKGRQVGVTGSLLHHKWESREGEKRSKVEINNAWVTFISDGSSRGDGDTRFEPATNAATSPGSTGGSDVDMDIPFAPTI